MSVSGYDATPVKPVAAVSGKRGRSPAVLSEIPANGAEFRQVLTTPSSVSHVSIRRRLRSPAMMSSPFKSSRSGGTPNRMGKVSVTPACISDDIATGLSSLFVSSSTTQTDESTPISKRCSLPKELQQGVDPSPLAQQCLSDVKTASPLKDQEDVHSVHSASFRKSPLSIGVIQEREEGELSDGEEEKLTRIAQNQGTRHATSDTSWTRDDEEDEPEWQAVLEAIKIGEDDYDDSDTANNDCDYPTISQGQQHINTASCEQISCTGGSESDNSDESEDETGKDDVGSLSMACNKLTLRKPKPPSRPGWDVAWSKTSQEW